jgi:hypothetical protein
LGVEIGREVPRKRPLNRVSIEKPCRARDASASAAIWAKLRPRRSNSRCASAGFQVISTNRLTASPLAVSGMYMPGCEELRMAPVQLASAWPGVVMEMEPSAPRSIK